MGGRSRWTISVLAAVLALFALSCVFSPQTARRSASGVPVQRTSITASQWAFAPAEVRVKANVPVELAVTSIDVDHGIEFTDLAVPLERVLAGRTVTVKFIPDKPGIYQFKCAVVCGAGHDRMIGILIVE